MISIELPADIEAKLTAKAQAKGVSLSEFIQDYLIQLTPASQ